MGLTPMRMTSARSAAARLSVRTSTPNWAESARARSGCWTVATIWSGTEEIVLEEGLKEDAAHLTRSKNSDAQAGECGGEARRG